MEIDDDYEVVDASCSVKKKMSTTIDSMDEEVASALALARATTLTSDESLAMRENESEDEKYLYKHPKDAHKIVAKIAIRPQSSISSMLSSLRSIVSSVKPIDANSKSDVNLVVQTLRFSKKEGDEIFEKQCNGENPTFLPPTQQEYKEYTMEERDQTQVSSIGNLRITISSYDAGIFNSLFDALIPCGFHDHEPTRPSPPVGLGPSVSVNALEFITRLENMLNGVADKGASNGWLIVDNMQLTFAFNYGIVQQEMDRSTKKIEAITKRERNESYLTYQEPPEKDNVTHFDSNAFRIDVPKLNAQALELNSCSYNTVWTKDELKRIVSFLQSEKEEKGHPRRCKVRINHVFVPPKDLRLKLGWSQEKMLPDITLDEWCGFVEYLDTQIIEESGSNLLSQFSMSKMISIAEMNEQVCSRRIPSSSMQQIFKMSQEEGSVSESELDDAFSDLCKKYLASTMLDKAPFSKDDYMCDIAELIFSKKKLETIFNAAAADENITLKTIHSLTDNPGPIVFQYIFKDKFSPPSKGEAVALSRNSFTRAKSLASTISNYASRPCTLVFWMFGDKVEIKENGESSRFNSMGTAPNGVAWRDLIPTLTWHDMSDDLMTSVEAKKFELKRAGEGGGSVLNNAYAQFSSDVMELLDFEKYDNGEETQKT